MLRPPLTSLFTSPSSSPIRTNEPYSKLNRSLSIQSSSPLSSKDPIHMNGEANNRETCNDGRRGTMVETKREAFVSCTTFNILAPIYKRLDKEDQSRRESEYRVYWLTRNHSILDRLLSERSSIICLQELWVGNEELVEMYDKRLGDAGYISFKLARTNNRGDGLLTAVHKDFFKVLNHCELHFNDVGDRVAQLLHIESVSSVWQSENTTIQQVLVVNTHLLFPHDYTYCIIRLRQVYKILQYVESYKEEKNLGHVPIILCGDWNGSKRGQVYKFLRSQGFVSSYDIAHKYTDETDTHKWVSHRNHRGNICGVDFIWLLNPNKHRKPLRTSWNEAIFCIIKYLLSHASFTKDRAFAFFKGDSPGEHITYLGFCEALYQLGLSDHPFGLSIEDVKHLWIQADADKDGLLNYFDFQEAIWDPRWMEDLDGNTPDEHHAESRKNMTDIAIGFEVKKAVLFPPEVETGTWPENYYLSDHAPLTVVFSPRTMTCSRPIF